MQIEEQLRYYLYDLTYNPARLWTWENLAKLSAGTLGGQASALAASGAFAASNQGRPLFW